jgi:hypothetical protein
MPNKNKTSSRAGHQNQRRATTGVATGKGERTREQAQMRSASILSAMHARDNPWPHPPRQWSARAPWNSSIWSILGKLSRSAVNFDRILTDSGFWATSFGTLPAGGIT